MNYEQIKDIEVEGSDFSDYPDFCDAFIAYGTINGRELTQSELEEINEDSDFVYSCVEGELY